MHNHLLRFREKTDLNIISVDWETQGLNLAQSNLPWQLGLVVIENGVIVKEIEKHLKYNNLVLSEDAARITQFNRERYERLAEPPEEVYDLLAEYLFNPKYIIIGSNLLNFDVYITSILQRFLGKKVDYSYVSRIYDIVALGRAYKLNERFPENKEDITPWMYRMMNYRQKGLKASLAALVKDFNIPYDENMHHVSATYDCKLAYQVFKQLYYNLEIH
jgi:DNA polymerase III epsilon subunit-like protein